jgi:hypothetical protein
MSLGCHDRSQICGFHTLSCLVVCGFRSFFFCSMYVSIYWIAADNNDLIWASLSCSWFDCCHDIHAQRLFRPVVSVLLHISCLHRVILNISCLGPRDFRCHICLKHGKLSVRINECHNGVTCRIMLYILWTGHERMSGCEVVTLVTLYFVTMEQCRGTATSSSRHAHTHTHT